MPIRYLSGLSVDSTVLVVDAANDRVGIGTASPARTFEVNGYISAFDGTTRTEIINGGGVGFFGTQTNHPLAFQTNNVERMRITSAGNVGIGTTSPTLESAGIGLDILNSSYTQLRVRSSSSSAGIEMTPGAGKRWEIQANASSQWFIYDRTDQLYRLLIDTAGNVGIGTTSPSQKLEVSGALVVGMTTPAPFWNALFKDYSDGSGVYISSINAGGGKYITGNAYYYNSALWRSDKTVASAINLDNGTVVFYTNSGLTANTDFTPTERMRITSAGNVGIGETSPDSKLEVAGNIKLGDTLDNTQRFIGRGDANSEVSSNGGSIGFISSTTEDHLTFNTHKSGVSQGERMRITAAGNVGIGTTAPDRLLTIAPSSGDAYINLKRPVAASTQATLEFNTAGTNDWLIRTDDASANLKFYSYGISGYALILAKSTGAATFSSSVEATSFIKTSGTASQYLMADGSVSTLTNPVTGTGTTNYVPKWTSGSAIGDSVIYDNGGNIGIGVTNADYPLTVGSINVGGVGANLGIVINSVINTAIPASSVKAIIGTTNSGFGYAAGSLLIQPRTGVNAVTVFTTEGTEKMRLTHDGNVGVNNTSPKTKLDINGQIGFGSKSMSMTDTFAAALTLNMNDHTGCYVKLTAFGDWGNHSTIAYLGEFFIQASAGGYNEPGIIIRQVDNTATDDIQAQILDPAGAGTRDFIIELKATSATATPFTAHLQYEVRGQYNSVS